MERIKEIKIRQMPKFRKINRTKENESTDDNESEENYEEIEEIIVNERLKEFAKTADEIIREEFIKSQKIFVKNLITQIEKKRRKTTKDASTQTEETSFDRKYQENEIPNEEIEWISTEQSNSLEISEPTKQMKDAVEFTQNGICKECLAPKDCLNCHIIKETKEREIEQMLENERMSIYEKCKTCNRFTECKNGLCKNYCIHYWLDEEYEKIFKEEIDNEKCGIRLEEKEKKMFRRLIVKSSLTSKGKERFERFLPDRLQQFIKREDLHLIDGVWTRKNKETENLIDL